MGADAYCKAMDGMDVLDPVDLVDEMDYFDDQGLSLCNPLPLCHPLPLCLPVFLKKCILVAQGLTLDTSTWGEWTYESV